MMSGYRKQFDTTAPVLREWSAPDRRDRISRCGRTPHARDRVSDLIVVGASPTIALQKSNLMPSWCSRPEVLAAGRKCKNSSLYS
jgi:hypothetical protein